MTARNSPLAADGDSNGLRYFLRLSSGRAWPLPDRGRLALGSDAETSGLVLEGAGIGDVHCTLTKSEDTGWVLQDLGSRAGTRVNGSAVDRRELRDGDVLQLGDQELTFTSSSTADTPGKQQQIAGFALQRLLGKGGMGSVWLAQQESLDRPVALKLLSAKHARDADFVGRFQAEARAAAALSHPNVVVVYDVGSVDGQHYLAMEYMGAGSLEDHVRDNGPMPWREAVRALRDCARGLAYGEERGIVHRDVKPDNLMRTKAGAVKLADLGLATARSGSENGGRILGTPHFLAPEQAKGAAPDHRSDLYSLGATGYRLLTARTPFQGESSRDIVRCHLTEQPQSPSVHVSGLPPALDALILSLLEKDPEQRPQTANQVGAELDAILRSDEAVATGKAKLLVGGLLLTAAAVAAFFLIPRGSEDNGQGNSSNTVARGENRTGGHTDGNSGLQDSDPHGLNQGSEISEGESGNPGDGDFFDAQARDSGNDALVEEQLARRELEAQLAMAGIPSGLQPEEEIRSLRAIQENYPGTPTARAIPARVASLEAELARSSEQTRNQSRAFDLSYATLSQSIGWPPPEGATWDVGKTLQSLFDTAQRSPLELDTSDPGKTAGSGGNGDLGTSTNSSGDPGDDSPPNDTGEDTASVEDPVPTGDAQAIPEDPAITAARAKLADEIVAQALADLVTVPTQLDQALEQARFGDANRLMQATLGRLQIPPPPENLSPARWSELIKTSADLRERGGNLAAEINDYRRLANTTDRMGLANIMGPSGSLRANLAANQLSGVLSALGAFQSTALIPSAGKQAGRLAGQLSEAHAAIELLIRSRSQGVWRRRNVALTFNGRSRSVEILGIDQDGLTVDFNGGEHLVEWNQILPNPEMVHRLFKGRFDRTLDAGEQRSVFQLLRLSGSLRAAELADEVLSLNSERTLNRREADELEQVFDFASRWLEDLGTGDLREELRSALSVDQDAAKLLSSALIAFQDSRWTRAVSDLETLLGSVSDSLLVNLLSEGTDVSDAQTPPTDR